jgi:hypothetical protein
MIERLITLSEMADLLHYEGRDRERSVRRCFQKHGLQLLKRDGRAAFATEQLYQELLWRMQGCSASVDEANYSMRAVQSASAGRSAKSRNTLRAAVNAKLRSNTCTALRPKSVTKPLMVLPGGRAD